MSFLGLKCGRRVVSSRTRAFRDLVSRLMSQRHTVASLRRQSNSASSLPVLAHNAVADQQQKFTSHTSKSLKLKIRVPPGWESNGLTTSSAGERDEGALWSSL